MQKTVNLRVALKHFILTALEKPAMALRTTIGANPGFDTPLV